MTAIVGVHGVHNFRAKVAPTTAARGLVSIWQKALRAGPLGHRIAEVPFSAAYYAHLLREPGSQAGGDDVADLSPEVAAVTRDWLGQWPLDPGIAQGIGTMPLRQALGLLAGHLGLPISTVERVAALFFPEVDRYMQLDTPYRNIVRAAVASTLAASPTPRIVLAHSLGSVITYEALSEYSHIEVELLVTLGSPLAMPNVVFHRLQPAARDGWGKRPPGVRRWVNVADKGDLIAVPRGGVTLAFHGVDDDVETTIHWAGFHKVDNYLKTPVVAEILRPYLRS